MRIDILIPSKNRAAQLALSRSNVDAMAGRCGARVRICDQSCVPTLWPSAEILHQPDLPGLPAARNTLIATSNADILIFLDDDTDPAPDLGECIRVIAAAEPHIAAWGPVVETRGAWPRRLHRLLHLGCLRDSRRLTSRRCDHETRELFGCCFAVRRSAALAVGGFDARLPGYALGEDRDFCWRLHAAGFRLRFVSALRAHHRAVGGQRPPLAARLRYLRWFAARHGRGNPATVLHLLLTAAAWSRAELLRPIARSA